MAFDASFNTTAPTGSGVGNREQLLDLTTVLAPRQAPVYGLLPKQAATADLVEWTVDGLRDPNGDNAVVEGKDVGDVDANGVGGDTLKGQFGNLTRLNNRLQHFRDTFNVSKKQEIFDSVTPVRIQEAEEKAASQVLRDIEDAICSDNGAVVGAGGAAGKLRGLGAWLDSTVESASGVTGTHVQETDGVQEVPNLYKTKSDSVLDDNDETDGVLSESRFNGMLTSVFEETGESQDLLLVAGTTVRNAIIDGFTRVQGATNNTFNQGDGTDINYNVEIFQGPYGVVKILSANPKCLPNQKRAYLLDPSLLGWSEAMSMGSTMLEDQGGGPRGYIDAMGTLCVKGPNGLGMIKDFS